MLLTPQVSEAAETHRASRKESLHAGLAITESCYRQIGATVGASDPETGIVLGGSRQDGVVRHVYFDRSASRTATTYSPDTEGVNALLREWWNPAEINLLGFAHSHPDGFAHLSSGDLVYAERILAANPALDRLLLPIVTVENGFVFHPFVVYRSGKGVEWRKVPLLLLQEELRPAPAITNTRAIRERRGLWRLLPARRPWWQGEALARVQDAYDLERLSRSLVVVVGVGGAMLWVEELARCGIGRFVFIDPDTVSLTNVGTQQAYRDEVGLPKVEALKARVRRINPSARVVARQQRLDDLDDQEVARLCGLKDKEPPSVTLLCGMTDSFWAQAHVNRLALHLGIPSLCAQLYAEGRGAEVTFTFPGVTAACHRCMLRSRYEAYLRNGYVNTVTSNGTPIFSTTRLNALKGFVALTLLHYGSYHPRWGGLLNRVGNRNLVQIRLHPDLELPVFDRVLVGDSERIFCDEAVWLPQDPEGSATGRTPCPDCGGTGDLRDAIGLFPDTRLPR